MAPSWQTTLVLFVIIATVPCNASVVASLAGFDIVNLRKGYFAKLSRSSSDSIRTSSDSAAGSIPATSHGKKPANEKYLDYSHSEGTKQTSSGKTYHTEDYDYDYENDTAVAERFHNTTGRNHSSSASYENYAQIPSKNSSESYKNEKPHLQGNSSFRGSHNNSLSKSNGSVVYDYQTTHNSNGGLKPRVPESSAEYKNQTKKAGYSKSESNQKYNDSGSANVRGSRYKMPRRAVLVGHLPSSCSCKMMKRFTNSFCYYFKKNSISYCRKRACKPSYQCVSKRTGLTCILRKTHTRIVPTGYNTCMKKKHEGYMYAPYHSH